MSHPQELASTALPGSARSTAKTYLPGEEGVWLFVLGDMMVFALFFSVFTYYRAENVALFNESQTHLSQGFGVFNTVLMLTSSWFVATAVKAARNASLAHLTPRLLGAAWLCGAGFVVVKFFEYREKILAGITLTTNDFFMYYFMFTGIHLVHVLIGLAVLGVMARYTATTPRSEGMVKIVESGATFWHLVDLLWIVLFGLLYLVK